MEFRKHGLLDITQPLIMYRDTYDGKNFYGLRNIKEERWLISPVYSYITPCENGFYKAWQETYCEYFNEEGKSILKLSRKDNEPVEIGDYIWQLSKDNQTAAIYNRQGEPVTTVDFTPYGTVYSHNGGYNSKKNTCEVFLLDQYDKRVSLLYQADGKLLLSEDMIPDDIKKVLKENYDISSAYLYIEDPFDPGTIVMLQYRSDKEAGEVFAYDIEQKRLLTRPGDKVGFYNVGKGNAYNVTDKTGTRLYNSSGEPLKTKDDKWYHGALEDGFYYRREPELITIGDAKGGTESIYRGEFEPETEILSLGKKITIIISGSEENEIVSVYDGEELMLSGDKSMWVYRNEGSTSIFDENTDEALHFDSAGTIIGWENGKESTSLLGTAAKLTYRGNYILITNEADQVVVKLLLGHMKDD